MHSYLLHIVLLLVSVLLANIPFITNRLLLFWPQPASGKARWLVLELALAYAIFLALAWYVEGQSGQVAVKGWQFFAVTVCFFLILAFPGFVWRFLLRQSRL